MQAVLVIFLIVVIKYPGRHNLKMVEFILAQSLMVQYTTVCMSCLWELLASDHIMSKDRHLITLCPKKIIIHACVSSHSPSYVVWDLSSGNTALHRVALLTSINPDTILLFRHAQRLIYEVVPDLIKLTTEINHHQPFYAWPHL